MSVVVASRRKDAREHPNALRAVLLCRGPGSCRQAGNSTLHFITLHDVIRYYISYWSLLWRCVLLYFVMPTTVGWCYPLTCCILSCTLWSIVSSIVRYSKIQAFLFFIPFYSARLRSVCCFHSSNFVILPARISLCYTALKCYTFSSLCSSCWIFRCWCCCRGLRLVGCLLPCLCLRPPGCFPLLSWLCSRNGCGGGRFCKVGGLTCHCLWCRCWSCWWKEACEYLLDLLDISVTPGP